MGSSVISFDSFPYGLPRGLRDAGDETGDGEFAEAKTADAELADVGVAAAATLAAVVGAHFELGRLLLLFDQTFLGHD